MSIKMTGSPILMNCHLALLSSTFFGSSNRSVRSLERASSIPEGFTRYSMQFKKIFIRILTLCKLIKAHRFGPFILSNYVCDYIRV